ncbi:hypothetical protein JCM5350_004841 [Sporobolomyces pararoseus]
MNHNPSSTSQILPPRPSLPSLRSLDISRYLPTTSPDSPPPAPDTVTPSAAPTSIRKLSTVEEEPEEEEGDVVVLAKSKVSSRFGMKLTTQVCVPCKSRRGKKTVGNKLSNGKIVRPALHRLPVRSTRSTDNPFPAVSRCDAVNSTSTSSHLSQCAQVSLTKSKPSATFDNSLQSSPISIEVDSSSPPSTSSSSSSRSTNILSNHSLETSYTPPTPSLCSRPTSVPFARYYDSSDSSPERFPISACR